jgi:hypothetical protein
VVPLVSGYRNRRRRRRSYVAIDGTVVIAQLGQIQLDLGVYRASLLVARLAVILMDRPGAVGIVVGEGFSVTEATVIVTIAAIAVVSPWP